jgi:hypothetical protein
LNELTELRGITLPTVCLIWLPERAVATSRH